MKDDLIQKGIIRPRKSPYTSPTFFVPKSGGGFWMVVDYQKVNSKIVFDSYPMPTTEQASEKILKCCSIFCFRSQFSILPNPAFSSKFAS